MTDLGRGYGPQGSEPWHPGDPGYGGQQPVPGQQDGSWQQPQQQHAQQPDQYGQPQYGRQEQFGGQAYPQQGFDGQQGGPQYVQGYIQGQQGQYGQQQGGPQYGQGQQGQGQYGRQQGQSQPQYGQQPYPQQQGNPQYVQQPYQQQGNPQQGFPGQQGQPGAYGQMQQPVPPQMAQQQAPQQAGQAARPQPQAQPAGPGPDGIDWEAEAAALEAAAPAEPAGEAEWDEHADGVEEYADEEVAFLGDEDTSREAQRKRKEKGKKSGRRNGGACLLVALVMLGGVAGAGWWGYGFYQQHFGPPPDFSGEGTVSVNVEIKSGSTGGQMGQALKEAGVVKSVEAFTAAYGKNPKAMTIQPGFFTMHREMSAEAAVKYLVDSAGGDALILPEGLTAAATYTKVDDKLKLPKGTTADAAKNQIGSLGLPDYAKGNLEGFLYPTRYAISEGMKPEELLKQMVAKATEQYQTLNLDAAAQKIGLKNAYELVTEASILQAEGNNRDDFGKMARTIQNRLADDKETKHRLGMDTTLQYSLGRKELTKKDIEDGTNKYNTYINTGLPPTPISNPGIDAIKAVINPPEGNWLYFIAMSSKETKFAATGPEHMANVEQYCTNAGQGFDKVAGHCTTK